MTEQTDQANLQAARGGAAPKTLDQQRGPSSARPAKSLDQIAAEQRARDDAAQHGIDPRTGEPRRVNPAPNPANPASHIDPTAGNAKQQTADAKASAARPGNITENVVTPESTAETQKRVADERNAHNEAGHALNMKRIEDEATQAKKAKPRNPNLGKQRDVNTPVIDPKTGAKTWPL